MADDFTPLQQAFLKAVRPEPAGPPAPPRPHDCPFAAIVAGHAYPCRRHEDGQHRFAAHWPACPAPYCRARPGHRELHDIPPGQPEIADRPAADGDPDSDIITDKDGRRWHRKATGDQPCRCHRSFAMILPFHDGHCCFYPEGQTCHPDAVAAWERERDRRHGAVQAEQSGKDPADG